MKLLCIESGTPDGKKNAIPVKKGEIYTHINTLSIGKICRNIDKWYIIKELPSVTVNHCSLFIELPDPPTEEEMIEIELLQTI